MPHESVDNQTHNLPARIEAVLAKAGLNQRQLADYLGVSRPYITHALHGKPISRPVLLLFAKFEDELDRKSGSAVSVNYGSPRTEEGDRQSPMLTSLPPDALQALDRLQSQAPTSSQKGQPPLVSAVSGLSSARSGVDSAAMIHAAPRRITERIPLLTMRQASALKDVGQSAMSSQEELAFAATDEHAFAVRVSGDAMAPQHISGELAIVYPCSLPHDGDRVLARLRHDNGGAVLFRIFHLSDRGQNIILSSPNPAYPALQYARDDFTWVHPIASTLRHLREDESWAPII